MKRDPIPLVLPNPEIKALSGETAQQKVTPSPKPTPKSRAKQKLAKITPDQTVKGSKRSTMKEKIMPERKRMRLRSDAKRL